MILALLVCTYIQGSMPTELNKPECYAVYDIENRYQDEDSCHMRLEQIMLREFDKITPTMTVGGGCFKDDTDPNKLMGHLKAQFYPEREQG